MNGFDENFHALYGCAYQAAFRIVGDREESEDIAQEALARASLRWRRVSSYGEPWVARVAINLALDSARGRRRRRYLPSPVQGAPDDLATERLELAEALRSLPRRQRQIVCLRYMADMPEAAVSEFLGCSLGTVNSHASRGIARLRLRLIVGEQTG